METTKILKMKLHSCILLINETHKFMSLSKLNTYDKRSTQFQCWINRGVRFLLVHNIIFYILMYVGDNT